MAEEDFEEEEQVLALTPLKDMGRSTENLLATLPEVVMWTGDPEQCIMREGLLEVVAGVLDDQIVLEWGIPCNRAMRHLFPSLTIKRRGKYKTTCFYGVEFADCYKHRTEDCLWYRGWSGPPGNVMDMVDSPGPFNVSKLSPYQTNHKTNSVLTKHNNKNIPPTENNIGVVMQDASPVLVSGNAPILTVKEECVVNTSEDAHVTEEPVPTVNIKCSTPVRTNNKHAPKVSVLENKVKIENVAIQPTTVVVKSTPNVKPSVHKTNSTGKLDNKNHVSSHINKLVELARQISPIVQKMDKKPANQEQSDAVIAMEHVIVDTDTATSVANSNSSSKDFWIRMEKQIRNNLKSTDAKSESSVITEAEHSDTSVGSSSNESAGAYPRTNHQNVNVTQHLTPQETVDMMKLLSQEKTSILNQTATRTRRISQPSKYSAYQLDAITPGPGEQKRPREKVHKEPKAVPTELGRLDELERLILLHPGPFITARIIHRRLQRLIPHVERGIQAMTSLQDRGLGQVYTLKQGSSRVFYKAIPHSDIEAALSDLSIKMEEYQSVFAERDPKLEESLHTKVKVHYPYLDQLPEFYNY